MLAEEGVRANSEALAGLNQLSQCSVVGLTPAFSDGHTSLLSDLLLV